MQITVQRHPSNNQARVIISAESEEELHDLDLVYQSIVTRGPKETRYENSNTVVTYFIRDVEIPSS